MRETAGTNANAPGERLGKLARVLTGDAAVQVRISRDGPALLPDGEPPAATLLVVPASAGGAPLTDDELAGWVDLLAARLRFGEPARRARVASHVTRALAEAIDDHRASLALLARFPGAAPLLARQREAAARETALRWPKLSWRERFVWRVSRALRGEAPPQTERSASLDATLAAASALIDAARASRSTAASIDAAEAIVERVRALARGDANNMMISVDRETTLDSPASMAEVANDFATEDESGAPDPLDARATNPAQPGATTLSDTAPAAPDADAAGDSAPAPRPARADTAPALSIPITTAFDTVTDLTGSGDATAWRKLRAAARAQTARLKAQLERALEADEQLHWRGEQERGELDRRALARLATSPGYRTPFRVRRARAGRDTAVTLLIDRSGSMAGRKIELARLCAAALCDALAQLGFACEALGYSSIDAPAMRAWHQAWLAAGHSPRGYNRFVERLDLQIYKRFDSDNPSGLARIESGHENPDGEALAWAAERLLARRARRRILMVLSDGYPATGDGDPARLRADLRARIAEIGARGVELIGVGILDDAVEAFYPTSTVVERLADLPAVAFEALGRALLGERGRAGWAPGAR
ncbi:cobaltochelatase CobT-related protein [Burkholderia plantarii]|uniref:cobaltochelatase CobT-related protein n=1 Tax=Burkholderia plantarii TaxID=41899 RepID=UPI0018DE4DC5|nr:cobalamin biosynthesis protein CobT [Burkholderia plantarii]MBI0330600.1 cobalamin biosynthesis protein CobT [Burkholderia plantarii]